MSGPLLSRLLLALVMLSPACARAQSCVVAKDLSVTDIASIQSLARRMGMQGPLRLCADYLWQPSACAAVRVDTLPSADGPRREWQQLYLQPRADRRPTCKVAKPGARVQSQGGWATSREQLQRVVAWRFQEGQEHADIQLGDGIGYAQAEVIIRALLDQRWAGDLDAEGRELLARWHREAGRLSAITSIYPYGKQGYEVRMGETGGLLVQVDVTDAVVTVIRVSFYLV